MRSPSIPCAPALALLAALTPPLAADETEQPSHEADLFSNTRQIILKGLRSGEGYFSADGSKMVFQSEREADTGGRSCAS